jgi:glycosyltransferase involved in cell wall biosynthesis
VTAARHRKIDVSVVIPAWDAYVELLPEAVESARAQAGVRVEVVVVENASSRPVGGLDDDVRLVRADVRLSAGGARNLGLEHVVAPLVLFLDADDQLLPGALEHLLCMLHGERDAVAAVGKHLLWNPTSGRELVVRRSPRPAVYRIARHRNALALLTLRYDCYPLVGCAVIRTEAARDAGGFAANSLGEDWALRSALAFRGRVLFSPTPVVRVRVRDGSLWHREHSRSELDEMFAGFRARRRTDPRLPLWGRAVLHPIGLAHRLDARRLTSHGTFRPAHEGLIVRTGAES